MFKFVLKNVVNKPVFSSRTFSNSFRGQLLAKTPTTKPVKNLYVPQMEKDSCGVGMIAQLQKKPSRETVLQANEMLVRMSHRGGCGCDPNSGDGAGILVALPHQFFNEQALQQINFPATSTLKELPKKLEVDEYAVGNVFFNNQTDESKIMQMRQVFNRVCQRYGVDVIGWRKVPTNHSELGESSLGSEPAIEQVFVSNGNSTAGKENFEKELLRIRNLATREIERKMKTDFYVCSLSSQTITYKGQLTPGQLYNYYEDLQQDSFSSYVALVHSRFSTNTFPSWDRAQPNRIMCHNGEINTLRGNKNWMTARSGVLSSSYFGVDSRRALLPVVSDNKSDSGNFDSTLELLTKASSCDRSLPEAMMMMIPEAWQNWTSKKDLSSDKLDMYKYNACVMEPWDGPAMMAFTDGKYFGATLDRNGLRPSRYYVTQDDHVILSSEIGVLPDLKPEHIKYKKRLEPGKMFLLDFDLQQIVSDETVKQNLATTRPYKKWVEENLKPLSKLVANYQKEKTETADSLPRYKRRHHYTDQEQKMSLTRRLNMFGFTTETMEMLISPMSTNGKEALGSMGNDAPLAILSEHPKCLFEYFKQLFAQVTNPPIDPIREDLVMSLSCPVGPEQNVLDATSLHAKRLLLDHPVLSLDEMEALKSNQDPDWHTASLDMTFAANSGSAGLVQAIDRLCEQAMEAITSQGSKEGSPILILSDTLAGPNRFPIPSLLALGAVHQHLIKTKQRSRCAIFLECGDAKEVHDFCTLLGFGADAVCPTVTYDAINAMWEEGLLSAHNPNLKNAADCWEKYRYAIGFGLKKVMSKMGISTLQSYKGAQVFEAVGIGEEIIQKCFTGTTSRLDGMDFDVLYRDIERFHESGYPSHSHLTPLLRNPGNYHYRNGEEAHFNTPQTIVALQKAVRTSASEGKNKSRELFQEYSRLSDAQAAKVTLRGLLHFGDNEIKDVNKRKYKLEDIEPVVDIVKRFNTGAMSLGSISQETHEALAVAMNSIGARSNTGEGGEDVNRFYPNPETPDKMNPRRSAIKQVASGRFGVTMNYLSNADQLQIKMAQGAKPGEGGELPGHKVSEYIGSMRHTTPGVGLISPPPHHDIYSIEDLAQLIFDLKNANRRAEISVKLVSEVGVGVVATGVAKAKADHITVSGHDGGTGASSWTGVKNGGLPWELGLAETQQTLVLNDLRSRVKLQTDGQIKTARDVIIAAALGAEEYGFSTAPLIALGCIMMRKCHLNTCPVGVATQDPELRKKFQGQPEHVVNFFFLLAEEIRHILHSLDLKSMDELIGRADLLSVNPDVLHYKSKKLDLSPLLINAQTSLNPQAKVTKCVEQDHETELWLDQALVKQAHPILDDESEQPQHLVFEGHISNENRTLGAMLSNEIARKYGAQGLPDNQSFTLKLTGHGGQSMGFGLVKGVTIKLEGDSNDYVGKALSGGTIIVTPPAAYFEANGEMKDTLAQENIIVGNAVLYGATSGQAFFNGVAGERFCVRNSGVETVVEGVGDHGCEYMTGGKVVILGSIGRNFAAGMSGGVAYLYHHPNEHTKLEDQINLGMVQVQSLGDESECEEVRELISRHVEHTGSLNGTRVLANWENEKQNFVRVISPEYEAVLKKQELKVQVA